MRKQQRIWENEHARPEILPSLEYTESSSGVVAFAAYLKSVGAALPLRVVDIGCGKGRNAIYLAKQGYEVYGMDYVKTAIDYTRHLAEEQKVTDHVRLYFAEIDRKWPFKDNFFDVAIDCFSSIDIETRKGREAYKEEMLRTLKSGGYVLAMVVSVNDEIEREFLRKYPGKEKNSTIWPGTGKFQKNYDEEELRDFYREFEVFKLEKVKKPAFKLGRHYTATNFWVVLRKP